MNIKKLCGISTKLKFKMMRSVVLKLLENSFPKQNTKGFFTTSGISEIQKDIKLLQVLNDMMVKKGEDIIGEEEGDALLHSIKDLAADYPAGRKLIMQYSRKQFKWTSEADSKFKKGVLDWARERKLAIKNAASNKSSIRDV
jgi:hypothetical protein